VFRRVLIACVLWLAIAAGSAAAQTNASPGAHFAQDRSSSSVSAIAPACSANYYKNVNGVCVHKILITALLTAVAVAPSAGARPGHVPAVRLSAPLATSAACSGAVSWQRARALVGQRATIRGRVVDSHFARSSSGQPTFLNMGNAYPNPSRFTVVIWRENRGSFGGSPETRFRGRTLCVTGLVQMYGGVPEIIARARTQIRIAG
jgi:hypothetical protein